MKKYRWFFSVTDIDSSNEAIKIAYQTAFGMAAIQAVIIIFISLSNPSVAINLADSVFMAALGVIIKVRKSRISALGLFIYSLFIAGSTLANKVGIPTGTFSGKNIILAVLLVYGAYKGVQGTFKYHQFIGTSINLMKLIKLSLIVAGYVILVTGLYFGAMVLPQFESFFLSISDSLLGILWIAPVLTVVLLGAAGLLPGTRNSNLTNTKNETEADKEYFSKDVEHEENKSIFSHLKEK